MFSFRLILNSNRSLMDYKPSFELVHSSFLPVNKYNKQCWLVAWLISDHLVFRDFGPNGIIFMDVCVVITAVIYLYKSECVCVCLYVQD
jgi:hypothetical protein